MAAIPRFEVVYELYGMSHHTYLRLKIAVDEEVCEVPSVTSLWRTADWHEREVYDMMGIRFTNHPDLRRILMWEGYPYFPLRKDFPLEGKPTDLPDTAFTDKAPLEGVRLSPAGANPTRRNENHVPRHSKPRTESAHKDLKEHGNRNHRMEHQGHSG